MQLKKHLLTIGFAMGLGLLSSAANATTWATSPVWSDGGGAYHACNVANVSSVAITDLRVDLYKSDGTILSSSGVFTLNPNQSYEAFGVSTYSGFARCRISSVATSGQIRGSIVVYKWNGAGAFYETRVLDHAR
jgi:hypothetical protein